uniref:LAGLIDADG endonuclease n=2 Tax=Fusarium fujikuroi species complex TaxID=171627 RepID=A0A6M4B229_9HYPO|nr:LAGLIDADG endonuclease [Fusarium ananatum]QJQ35561.1 LAGLIDADG endonuclease [Fusarium guttiforme]
MSTYVGCKLSNSGEPLKLLVLSHIWKYMSGWINYSGIVTSQKMSENKMGNRGSKSIVFKNTVVKEQRVNGSWCGINLPHLRCTLLGFERSYLVKILSNQIIQRQFYSSESNLDNNQLAQDPWFISGFSDAEGCFLVLVRKSPKSKLGWQIEANFTINLHVRDLDLLKLIQTYFGVGRIGKERNGCRDFTIGSLDQIITKVIPHFDKYPLKTNKYSDYLLFKQVVMMMQRGEHLTAEGLQKIISIRASLNRGLTPLLLEAFPNTVALVRPLLPPSVKLDPPQWVAGFTSGDGCFKVSIRESKLHKTGSRVVLLFVVTQHIRDELLLKSLVDFFGCGQTYSYKDYIEFRCQSFKDNYVKILPFFDKYPIIGVKSEDFKDWTKVAKMIQTKVHLTNEGFDQIRQIRTGMNKGRYLK